MLGDSTPGRIGSVRCTHCAAAIFYVFAGGPHQLLCPNCRTVVALEVVFDGTKWRSKYVSPPPDDSPR
jgi:phage FluMu protein Com